MGSAEGGSSTERLFTSAGYPAFQKALEKSVGKSKRKKKKCIQTKQVLVNSQTSGNRVGFFCFILYCFSDSSSVFSFYYKSVFSFLEGLHPFRTANAEHCIIYINLLLRLGFTRLYREDTFEHDRTHLSERHRVEQTLINQ